MSTAELILNHESLGREDAPALLLGGSLGTAMAMWDPQVEALGERLRVVRFDHRGHGGSPVPEGPYSIEQMGRDVLALMDRLALERASYCGLSIGGMVGMWLAANAPERVERLVLICTSAYLPPAEGWRARAEAVRAAGSVEVVADAVLARWLTPGHAAAHPGVAQWLRRMLVSSPPAGYAACCEAIAELDLRDSLPRISAPTLVIAGVEDEAIPPPHSERIAAAIADARLELLSPMAHIGNVEQPQRVTELILAHVAGAG
jgi:3-oxoadipate enol-lactonase